MSNDDNPFAPGSDHSSSAALGYDVDPVPLDVGPIVQRALTLFTNNPGVVLGALLIPLVPNLAFGSLNFGLLLAIEDANDENVILLLNLGRMGISMASSLIGIFFQLGAIQIFLNLARGESADLGMLVGGGGMFARGVGVAILMGLITALGLLALIIPGIIAGIGLQFALYCLVDRDLGVVESLTESWAITDGNKVTIFLINLLIGITGLLFACVTLGFGYILIVPVLSLVQAVMYQSLRRFEADLA